MEILRHILENVTFVPTEPVLKVTGRYYVRNISDIILSLDGIQIASANRICPGFLPTECFLATPAFLSTYLCRDVSVADDEKHGFWSFERAFTSAVEAAMEDGLKYTEFCPRPDLEGISGGFNVPWNVTAQAHASIMLPGGALEIRSQLGMLIIENILRSAIKLGTRPHLDSELRDRGRGLLETIAACNIGNKCEYVLNASATRLLSDCTAMCLQRFVPPEFGNRIGCSPSIARFFVPCNQTRIGDV